MIQWPDFFASDYISRPKELENVSAYEFVMWYEKKIGSIKINKIDEEIGDCNLERYRFLCDHPGYKFVYLQKRKHMVVPRIMYNKGNWPRIDRLKLFEKEAYIPDQVTMSARETYGKMSLMLFLPFRTLNDLKSVNSNSYWIHFQDMKRNKRLFQDAVKVLQNIENQVQLKNIMNVPDSITKIQL